MIQASGSNGSTCLVYNYYADKPNPTSCALPAQGRQNNGNMMGYWYNDSVQSGFNHTASYTYDNVNRLTQATATGNATYNQTYAYGGLYGDGSNGQYGNMTCVTGCTPALWTLAPGTNQLLPPSSYSYDAAGNLTKDSSNGTAHTYQWDAEGRVASVDSGSTWSFTYNAVGDRVQWVSPGGTGQHMFDPAGNWLGIYGSLDLVRFGDRHILMYNGSETYFNHVNHLNSTAMMTNHAGAAVEDVLFYPWGQNTWQVWGSGGYSFAGMPYYDTTTGTNPTEYRFYTQNLGRWLSPDPVAGDITNPQSLNRYAYVMNNPTTSIDPLGLDPCTSANTGPGGSYACSPQQASQSNIGGLLGQIYNNQIGVTITSMFEWLFPAAYVSGDGGHYYMPTVDWNAWASLDLLTPANSAQPIYCNGGFIRASNAAWMRAGDGSVNTEAGFWVTGTPGSPSFTPLPFTNQNRTITNLVVPAHALALVHTHPDAGVAQPSPGDVTNSNNSGLPFYVLSSRGLWLHNPGSPKSTMVRPGTSWQKPC